MPSQGGIELLWFKFSDASAFLVRELYLAFDLEIPVVELYLVRELADWTDFCDYLLK